MRPILTSADSRSSPPQTEDPRCLPRPGDHDPYVALRVPDYRRLLGVLVLSGIGGEAQAVAVGWELYQRTGSAIALGLTGLAHFLPVLLLSLPAGHAADHSSRKRLLLISLVMSALASAELAELSLSKGPIPLIYVCLVLTGGARAFSTPSQTSLLPELVPPHLLGNAVTWNSSGWQLASISGPALGGLALALSGLPTVAYMLAASCALASAGLIAPIQPQPLTRSIAPRSLLAGVHFVWQTDLLLAAITLDLFAVLVGGTTALLPIFAQDILHIGPAGLGWLRSAPALGAIGMALMLAHRPPLRRPGHALVWSVAGFGATTVGFGLSQKYAVLSFVLLALTGALNNISVVVRGTLMQILTPDVLRGRVAAVNSVFINSSNELGAFESGMTAAWFGPVASVVGGGVGTILVVMAVLLRWPRLLALELSHPMAQTDTRPGETTTTDRAGLLPIVHSVQNSLHRP
jgi:predicted MFS family arabinose efflux permease